MPTPRIGSLATPVSDSELDALIDAIDPETCEAMKVTVNVLDPYGVVGMDPEEETNFGRVVFVRAPGKEIWVWFGDLPDGVYEKICAKPGL